MEVKIKTANNIVTKEKLREVQKEILRILKDALMKSAGPYGSTTMILHEKAFTEYSKDGFTILENISFTQPIENSIADELTQLTRYITRTVGDGTTSAVVLSSLIFDGLCELEGKYPPYMIINTFKKVVESIKKTILAGKRDLTLEDVYKISMICTNSNEEVSTVLSDIYREFGLDVWIDLGTSTTEDNIIKTYEGLTFECGLSDPAMINHKSAGAKEADECIIRNANIYAFKDPIDTPEMASFFKQIIMDNIIQPYQKQEQPTPTVIMCPKLSIDNSSFVTDVSKFMLGFPIDQKPPLLIVTNIGPTNTELYTDIYHLCGCKEVKKYLDLEMQNKDIEDGKAPTLETIHNFAGFADEVKSNVFKTTFINPDEMFVRNADTGLIETDENGEFIKTDAYAVQVSFLEGAIASAIQEGEDIDTIGNLKKRLHCLKSNMVELLIGGITVTDRDSVKALVEDAVKNIRSASEHGVGYGCNFEGLRASLEYESKDEIEKEIVEIIYNSYHSIITELLKTVYGETKEEQELTDMVCKMLEVGHPLNLVTLNWNDSDVLSSIQSDVIILDIISKIISVMVTSNQATITNPLLNTY